MENIQKFADWEKNREGGSKRLRGKNSHHYITLAAKCFFRPPVSDLSPGLYKEVLPVWRVISV